MILVDSSVWIDYFNGVVTPQTDKLHSLLGREMLSVGDLMLTEVLQGFARDKDFRAAQQLLAAFHVVELGGEEPAIQAARNYRKLRSHGFTVRKTIDSLIATTCLAGNWQLLHSDRDFDGFSKHLGLKVVDCEP